jgi:hypothetical protein
LEQAACFSAGGQQSTALWPSSAQRAQVGQSRLNELPPQGVCAPPGPHGSSGGRRNLNLREVDGGAGRHDAQDGANRSENEGPAQCRTGSDRTRAASDGRKIRRCPPRELPTLQELAAEVLLDRLSVDAELARGDVEASRFHTCSVRNQCLIAAQCPTATRAAGYQAWRRLGRWVRRHKRRVESSSGTRRFPRARARRGVTDARSSLAKRLKASRRQ